MIQSSRHADAAERGPWARWLGVLLGASALAASAAWAQQPATRPAPIESIKVVLDDNYPPYIFRDDAGELQGVLKDRWALWQERTGVKVDLQAMSWAQALRSMRAGEVDVIDTIFDTPERRLVFDFSAPYATIDVSVFFHEALAGLVNPSSIRGFTVGVKAGDACIETLHERGVDSMKVYPGYSEVILAAQAGEVRMFCVDLPPALYLMQQLGISARFRHSLPLSTGQFHRAVRKGDAALLALVERGFNQLTAAEMKAIDRKWFGAPVPSAIPHAREAAYAVATGVVMLGALFAWNFALRRRVRARTAELAASVDEVQAARRAAEHARDQLDATLSAIPDLLFEVDGEGRYYDFRGANESLLVAPAAELLGRRVHDVMPPDAVDTVLAALRDAARDGSSAGRQMRLELPDGEHLFELSVARKRPGEGAAGRYIVMSRDITARKDAELALQQSEHRFRQFFEAGLVGMAITVPGKQWSQINARLAEMLGYSIDELELMTWAELTHPDDLDADVAEFQRVVAGECDGYTLDKRFIRKDGSVLDAAIAVRCERGADGLAQRFYAIVEDISARKRAERALAEHSDRLEAQVEARSRELVEARDQAQAASRAKSELLSRMSHELRTPMNAILGFAQLLEVDRALAPTARRFVTEILRAGKHLLNLINDVLDLAQVESGRVSLSPERVVAADLVAEVRALLQPLADRRGVGISVDVDSELAVCADRTRLKQVMVNLLSNAIKYNRNDGQVIIEVVERDAETLRLLVRDTGPGIEPSRLAELFQPFNRLGAEFGTIEGTGIGLSICARLVDLMGGRIGADSVLGQGCTFWVELPRALPTASMPEAGPVVPVAVDARPISGIVLHVEDNPANLRLMEHVVARQPGLRLMSAPNAELGIALAREHLPDLILLDINLPGMDGYAALDTLRADPRTRHIPAVALTANAMPSDAKRAIAAGFEVHVAKPIDLNDFDALLRRLLSSPG